MTTPTHITSGASATNNGRTTILAAFGLTDHKYTLGKAMGVTRAIISGSAALYWWLNDTSATPIPIPDTADMDIWVPIPKLAIDDKIRSLWVIINYFESVLSHAGYTLQSTEDHHKEISARYAAIAAGQSIEEMDYTRTSPMAAIIRGVYNFQNPILNRKIQVIAINDTGRHTYKITDTFDLDICKFFIHAYIQEGKHHLSLAFPDELSHPSYRFLPFKPNTTIPLTMRLGDLSTARIQNVLARLEKYYSRGFVLETHPTATTPATPLTLDDAKDYARRQMPFREPKDASDKFTE